MFHVDPNYLLCPYFQFVILLLPIVNNTVTKQSQSKQILWICSNLNELVTKKQF